MSPLWKPKFTISTRPDFLGKMYGSGEEVIGELHLLDAMPELIGAIDVKLWGGIKIERTYGEYDRGIHKRSMFLKECTVNAHSTTLEAAESYSWPFRISFPEMLKMETGVNRVDEMLPPSYTHLQIRWGAFIASIEYKLTASIYKHQSPTPMYKAEKELRFSPTLPLDQPLFSLRNFDLYHHSWSENYNVGRLVPMSENEDEEWSVREKSRITLQPGDLASSTFKFTLTFPTVLLVGSQLVVQFGMEYLSGYAIEAHLHKLTVTLIAHDKIELHDAQHSGAQFNRGEWCHTWYEQGVFSKNEGWTKMLSITIPESVIPTFTTHKIKRSYCLRVNASTLPPSTYSFPLQTIPVEVLPRRRVAPQQGPSSDLIAASMNSQPSSRAPEAEILPTYEEALLAPVLTAPPRFED